MNNNELNPEEGYRTNVPNEILVLYARVQVKCIRSIYCQTRSYIVNTHVTLSNQAIIIILNCHFMNFEPSKIPVLLTLLPTQNCHYVFALCITFEAVACKSY